MILVQLYDLDDNFSEIPITLEIVCPDPEDIEFPDDYPYPECVPVDLFVPDEDFDPTTDGGITTTGGAIDEEDPDQVAVTISASITILSDSETAEVLVDAILNALDDIQVFQDDLIPEGGVVPITEEMAATLTDEELEAKVFMNNYAVEMGDIA